LILFSFFFQAEDGIRDDLVTGVQTCALPICQRQSRGRHGRVGWLRPVLPANAPMPPTALALTWCYPQPVNLLGRRTRDTPSSLRSEERRVGKECRTSRQAPARTEDATCKING